MTHSTTFGTSTDISANRRTAKALRIAQALVFLGLGGWCLLAPQMVEALSLKAEYQHLSATTALLMGCFGAQAVLCGSLMLLARFTAATFLGFGLLASIPFFIFNAWFVWVAEMFTAWMLLDFAGNVSFLVIGLFGWRLMRGESDPV